MNSVIVEFFANFTSIIFGTISKTKREYLIYYFLVQFLLNIVPLNNLVNLKIMKQSTKNKSQIYIIKFVILFFLALTLSNCQVEEDIDKKESGIQTIDINEALSFLKFNLVNSSSKTGKKSFLLPDLNAISQEKIINSDQLLTVIPLSTNNSEEYSRILMVRLRDTLKTVVFSMYSDKDLLTEYFSGKIMVRNLNGDFVSEVF